MTNKIEITVSAVNETAPTFEEIQALAVEAGTATGEQMASAVSEALRLGLDTEAQAIMAQMPATIGPSAAAAGEEIGAALSAGVEEGGAAAVAAAQETDRTLASVFSDILRNGKDMSFGLANAMAAAWEGIEADTARLTAAEKARFAEFNQILATAGEEAAIGFAKGLEPVMASTVTLTAALAPATEALNRFGYGVEQATGQVLLFQERDAPGMFTQVAAAAPQAAAGFEEVGAAAEAAAGQLELFTAAELKWVEQTNMAQRPASFAPGPGEQVLGSWGGSQAEADAAKTQSALKGVEQEAGNTQGAFGALGSFIMGPWGYAIMGGAMMLSYFGSSLFGASAAAQQLAAAQQALDASVAQDSNVVATNTTAQLAQQLVKMNLLDLTTKLGVSQATLIEAAAGESDAQKAVAGAYDAKAGAITKAVNAGNLTPAAEQQQRSIDLLHAEVAAFDELTAATVKATATDQEQNEALIAANETTQIFNATLTDLKSKQDVSSQSTAMASVAALGFGAGQQELNKSLYDAGYAYQQSNAYATSYTAALTALAGTGTKFASSAQSAALFTNALIYLGPKLEQAAVGTSLNTVASLGLGVNQSALNLQLYTAVDAYTQSTAQAAGYNTVLTALNGTTNNLLASEAAFTIALAGVATAAASNGLSLDVNNDKGAKNIQTFAQLATSAIKTADAVYQNEVATKGSSLAYDDANAKLEQEKNAFIAAADKAGFNKTAVQQLADELYKLPAKISVDADVSHAVSTLNGLLQRIDNSAGYVQIYGTQSGGGTGGKALLAHGGGVGAMGQAASGGARGNWTIVGEQGIEAVELPYGSTVRSNPDTMAALAGGGGGGWGVARLEVLPGGSSAFEQFMVTALSNWVRVRFGADPKSVQKTFGQSS